MTPAVVGPVLAVDAGQTEIRAALDGRIAKAPGVLRMGERVGPDEVGAGLLMRIANPSRDGVSVTVERTAARPLTENPRIAMESPLYPARMTVARGGERTVVAGFWECGP